MRYSPEHKAETHARIVRKASVRLRERGANGVGVADIMKEAGLTHGGFYAHFPSRDALMVEALERAQAESAANVAATAGDKRLQGASAFRKLVEAYLSDDHLKDAECGCP